MRFFYLIMIGYIFIEVVCTTAYIAEFGAWMFFLEFVITSLLSMFIMFLSRGDILEGFKRFTRGEISLIDFLGGNFARIFGAFLLLFPGIFADFLGIILEIYAFFVLKIAKRNLGNSFFKDSENHSSDFGNFKQSMWNYQENSNQEIIEVEIVQEQKNLR
ncbi:hypothetical protein BKH42_06340 [Helicobacter sp. 13S00482-2]|uniref:FxsA family protein n=1 Tax=Helicobacter sp. 13S00482-2 TaxID=1476200 RepID=UPI000BA56F6D|nr:FxsA family protein [Helicobacter sp. 13S00482-2]PAF53334.1 hypothetical protein BKH42_06340 [Helicobacter sp. 13S00482-2]